MKGSVLAGFRAPASKAIAWARKYRAPIGYLLSGLLLAYLGWYLYKNWRALSSYELALNPLYVVLALAVLVPTYWIPALFWWRIVADVLRVDPGPRVSVRLWFTSQISRYLPGGVWNYLSRVYLFAEQGVPAGQTALGLVVETVLTLMAQVLVFLFSLPFWSGRATGFYWTLLILPTGLLLLHPATIRRLMAWIARLQGKTDAAPPQIQSRWLAKMLGGYFLGALLGGLGFALFVQAIYPVSPAKWPTLAGMVYLAQLIGFLTLPAPSGLGVRESTLALLLSLELPGPVAAVVALASRLWLLVGELIGLGLSRLL